MRIRRQALAFVLTILFASPVAAQQNFHLSWDEDISFRKYQSYIWAPRVTRKTATLANYARTQESISRYLASRGFNAASDGQFVVGFTLSGTVPGDFEGSYQPGLKSLGSLSIDIYDAASKRPIWHADMSASLAGKPSQQQIDKAVQTMLNRFPPSHGCSHSARHTIIFACPAEK